MDTLDGHDVIYLRPHTNPVYRSPQHFRYVLMHEYAHVLQARVARASNGGHAPSASTVSSLGYYVQVLELNDALSDLSPPVKDELRSWRTTRSGMETSADCVTQVAGVFFSTFSYVGIYHCDAGQLAAARDLLGGRWPVRGG